MKLILKQAKKLFLVAIIITCTCVGSKAQQHVVTFCGEPIPISNKFVAEKLMGIIKRMVPVVNMQSMREQALAFFPYIESQLLALGLPLDLKYIPVVESNFKLLSSHVGARGFWQLMPATATDYGLIVSSTKDERDDIFKATPAACKLLNDYYRYINRTHKIKSWVLTAAAYNYGNGNITKAIRSQGGNYFTMNLNPETAAYVYKIIAVKELFENPELFMKDFGYNIFNQEAVAKNAEKMKISAEKVDTTDFEELVVETYDTATIIETVLKPPVINYLKANVVGKYNNFNDGDLVSIKLSEDLIAEGSFRKKGSIIRGKAYIIDNRVMVDLGYDHFVMLYDFNQQKGFPLNKLKDGYEILLGVETYPD